MEELLLQIAGNTAVGLGAVAGMVIGIVLYWPGQAEKCAAWLRARAVYRRKMAEERGRLMKDRAELAKQLLSDWGPPAKEQFPDAPIVLTEEQYRTLGV